MIFRIYLFALILVGISVLGGCAARQDLTLSLRLDKSAYKQGEAVLTIYSFQNSSPDNLILQARMADNALSAPAELRDIYYLITSPTGKTLEFATLFPRTRLIEQTDFVQLRPGESYENWGNISLFYGPFKEYGQYTVQLIYENQTNPGNGGIAWKGKIDSNKVSFTIEP
jgi:hypothetical protein